VVRSGRVRHQRSPVNAARLLPSSLLDVGQMSLAPASPDPLIGAVVAGRYHVQRRVAAGGMGVVYEAMQQPLGRRVALKVIRGDASDPVAQKRFEREARAASALQDAHVVVVHDFGVIDDGAARGGLYLAMEYLEGITLREHLVEAGRLAWRRSVEIVHQVASALAAAHRAGLVHRDLKPENIMLSKSGSTLQCKVLDFGLAKGTSSHDLFLPSDDKPLTRSGGFVGTPGYISPEVIDGAQEDPRQDVYSLGVLWWELISGRHPFPAETPMKTLVRQLHEDPPPIDKSLCAADGIPDDGLALIAAMMARSPGVRPTDGEAVVVALRRMGASSVGSSDENGVVNVDENAVTVAAARSSVPHQRPDPSSAPASKPSAERSSQSLEAVTVQGRRRGVKDADGADHAEATPPEAAPDAAQATPVTAPAALDPAVALAATSGVGASLARRRRRRLRERVQNAALLALVIAGAVFLVVRINQAGDDPDVTADAGAAATPPPPAPPAVVVTEIVVDGVPTFGALKFIRERLGAHQLRLYRSGHAELWLKGDVGATVADQLQDVTMAIDGRQFLVVVEDVEPGRVVVKVVVSDDAVVFEDAGVSDVPGGLEP